MVVDLEDAGGDLKTLAKTAMAGEEVTLTQAGKPVLKLTSVAPPAKRRLGDLERLGYTVPDDFNTMFDKEIEEMFYGPAENE